MSINDIKSTPIESWFTAVGVIFAAYLAIKLACLIAYSLKWAFIDMKHVYKINRKHGRSRIKIFFAISLAFFVAAFEIALDRICGRERVS